MPPTWKSVSVVALLLALVPSGPVSISADARVAAAERPRVEFGAFVEGMQSDRGALGAFENLVRAKTDIASYYYGFGDIFPAATERYFADGGQRKVLVSWDMGPTRFREWTTGKHDAYLDQIVAAARDYPYQLHVRPWPEMNGDWQEFQPTPSGDRPYGGTYDQFIAAWRHVVSYTREQGATNLRWVFNPTVDTYAQTTPVKEIWPGARYVDILGIDGFNWGKDASWGRWKSFNATFQPMYKILTGLDATAPVWICEFGSKEPRIHDGAPIDPDQDKGTWMKRAFNLTDMPRVRALIYFNARKERDWRVNSSRASLRAVRDVLNAS